MLQHHGFELVEGDYKYLIKMPMDSVSTENVEKIMKEKETTETELDLLIHTSLEQMWLKELNLFEQEYGKYRNKLSKIHNATIPATPSSSSSSGGKQPKMKKINK